MNLDIFWLKDDALEESANLPAPEIIVQEITDDLEAALEQFSTSTGDLKKQGMNRQELTDWLCGLASEVKKTKPAYPHNVVYGCPIPFFGDVLKARVLTSGVNPPSGEFGPKRNWSGVENVKDWKLRLKNYFNHEAPPDKWFGRFRPPNQVFVFSGVAGVDSG